MEDVVDWCLDVQFGTLGRASKATATHGCGALSQIQTWPRYDHDPPPTTCFFNFTRSSTLHHRHPSDISCFT